MILVDLFAILINVLTSLASMALSIPSSMILINLSVNELLILEEDFVCLELRQESRLSNVQYFFPGVIM